MAATLEAPPEAASENAALNKTQKLAALLVILSGLRLLHFQSGPSGWVFVQLACWLGISSLTGIAYRRREKAALFAALALVLAVIAVAMAYVKPF